MREILIEPVDVLIIDIENTCMHEQTSLALALCL